MNFENSFSLNFSAIMLETLKRFIFPKFRSLEAEISDGRAFITDGHLTHIKLFAKLFTVTRFLSFCRLLKVLWIKIREP